MFSTKFEAKINNVPFVLCKSILGQCPPTFVCPLHVDFLFTSWCLCLIWWEPLVQCPIRMHDPSPSWCLVIVQETWDEALFLHIVKHVQLHLLDVTPTCSSHSHEEWRFHHWYTFTCYSMSLSLLVPYMVNIFPK